jgi:hypothetical protein
MSTATLEAPAPSPTTDLTARDRCDACGAQAYVEVGVSIDALNIDGRRSVVSLLFCGHHYAVNEPSFATNSNIEFINDERSRLVESERKRTLA